MAQMDMTEVTCGLRNTLHSVPPKFHNDCRNQAITLRTLHAVLHAARAALLFPRPRKVPVQDVLLCLVPLRVAPLCVALFQKDGPMSHFLRFISEEYTDPVEFKGFNQSA